MRILGVTVGEGDGMLIEGLGTNCTSNAEADFSIAAKVEFGAIPYGTLAMIYDAAPKAEGESPMTDCEVGGHPALCQEGYQAAITFGAKTIIQIGSPDDVGLLVESNTDVADATAMAEIVLANLGT